MTVSLDWSSAVNVAVVMMGVVLSTMLAIHLRFGQSLKTPMSRYSGLFYLCMVFFSVANLMGQLLNGDRSAFARAALPIACNLDYVFTILLLYAGSGLLFLTAVPTRIRLPLRRAMRLLVLAQLVLLTVSQFTGLLYIIDAQNVYLRTPWYPLSLVVPALIICIGVCVLIRYRKNYRRREAIAFAVFLLFPIGGVVLQFFFYNMVAVMTIFASLWLFGIFTSRQITESYRQEATLQQLRTQIMLSQIQPHFLYNSLGTIAELCDSDPQKAKETTLAFSDYLRGNLTALSTDQPIPFAQELEHTRQYLAIQKVRFGEALQLSYEIGCSAFRVPALSLQPLAENAVRHGVRQNPGGRGTVRISTAETAHAYEITVADDGPGFGAGVPDPESLHVGLQNVRERLRLNCGGSLELTENVPHGVVATIRIPKT